MRQDVDLERSFQYCSGVARREARNFYYSFLVLPPEKRKAMCAVYAFMRYCDDIADSPGAPATKRDYLEAWGKALTDAMQGDFSANRILPAFRATVDRYAIPSRLFEELIEGAGMDLSTQRFATFGELYQYCYQVASVVGLVCIRIFGFVEDEGQDVVPTAEKHAEQLGIAFQLTNILRDVPEDAAMGRIYLPLEDLAAFQYPEEDLLAGVVDDRFLRLVRFEAQRAREYYAMAQPLLSLIHPSSRPCLAAMSGIYSGILDRIERQGYNVFAARARLSAWRKLGVAASSWVRHGLAAR